MNATAAQYPPTFNTPPKLAQPPRVDRSSVQREKPLPSPWYIDGDESYASGSQSNSDHLAPAQPNPKQVHQQQISRQPQQRPSQPYYKPAGRSQPGDSNAHPASEGANRSRSRPPSYSAGDVGEVLSVVKFYHDRDRSQRQESKQSQNTNHQASSRQNGTTKRPVSPPPRGVPEARANNHGKSVPPNTSPPQGASIQRLKSPSIMTTVLQPLNQKVREYDAMMQKEQEEITRLEDEIHGLQAKRAQAQTRYFAAKNKHDDYQRQHQDVERALKGEAPLVREPLEHRGFEMERDVGRQQPAIYDGDDDEEDIEEDEHEHEWRAQERGHSRAISQQSVDQLSPMERMKNRFRMSFFGDRQD